MEKCLRDNENESTALIVNETTKESLEKRIRPAPSRFRNMLSKYSVRRSRDCINCGLCAELCPYGVHSKVHGFNRMSRPLSHRCIGPDCSKNDFFCVRKCPQGALDVFINPVYETLGDYRWTADLILSTWYQAETGQIHPGDLEYRTGNSGGGFDRLRFRFSENQEKEVDLSRISTQVELNRRDDNRPRITIDVPFYGGGMSFGSVSLSTMLARARSSQLTGTFTCTGEGGYPEELKQYDDCMITQVATGLFGVSEETIKRVRIVVFKYAQGAKPGLGGHLLGDKNTADVARMREAVQGSALFSPFPFHSVYSVEDHKKHVDWIREVNPEALVSVKVSTPTDVDMVAVGSFYAGAHIIHLDGSYGGTGAAPEIAKKNIAMPIEYAIPKVHSFLKEEGIRDNITLVASGGIRTADDIAKAIALGADAAVLGTTDMVALECIRCGNCESGRGCARGIATTDQELAAIIDVEWATQRLVNLYSAFQRRIREILYNLGLDSIADLRGRTDLLRHLDYEGDIS